MEVTCSRCQQTIQPEDCFCPSCGLPHLLYTTEAASTAQTQPEPSPGAPRDAGQVQWKPALRSALALALPAGLFCSVPSSVSVFGLLLMAGAGAWVVTLYMRGQRPKWLTAGAGARIGLVTGILAGALFFALSSATIFVERYGFHQGDRIDSEWKSFVDEDLQLSQHIFAMIGPADQAQVADLQARQKARMLSPEGHAGMVVGNLAFASFFLILFAMAGGALGARTFAHTRRTGS